MAPAQGNTNKQDDGPPDLSEHSDLIDISTFEQILEMDDDEEDREFSKGIVYGFFEQAETTFDKMDSALNERNFDKLSELGHFLKGSSATLGLNKIKDACEKIQHCREELVVKDEADKEKTIDGIEKTLKEVKSDYKEVAKLLERFYGESGEAEADDAQRENPDASKLRSQESKSPEASKSG